MDTNRFNKLITAKRIFQRLSDDEIKSKRQINAYIMNLDKKYNTESNFYSRRDIDKLRQSLKRLK